MSTEPPLFIHASSKGTHIAETMEHRQAAEEAQKAEYWRKLYVAMTRAEDELYVTGYLTKARNGEGSWYEAIENGLRDESEVIADAEGNATAMIYPRDRVAYLPVRAEETTTSPTGQLVLPALPAYKLRRIVRPSRAADDVDPTRVLETNAERLSDPRDPEAARKEGIALHALLQHLSQIDPIHWHAVAARALPVLLPDLPVAHAPTITKARSILTRPELAHLYGPDSRGEVPILAQGTRNKSPVTIAGRIDRLIVKPDRVLIVDYKSDANAPKSVDAVPAAYLTQMGLYALVARQLFPGLAIEAAILWTSLETLTNLSQSVLREAVAGFTIG
jgi:ATP-dependent helicase/nuclease subunit A